MNNAMQHSTNWLTLIASLLNIPWNISTTRSLAGSEGVWSRIWSRHPTSCFSKPLMEERKWKNRSSNEQSGSRLSKSWEREREREREREIYLQLMARYEFLHRAKDFYLVLYLCFMLECTHTAGETVVNVHNEGISPWWLLRISIHLCEIQLPKNH